MSAAVDGTRHGSSPTEYERVDVRPAHRIADPLEVDIPGRVVELALVGFADRPVVDPFGRTQGVDAVDALDPVGAFDPVAALELDAQLREVLDPEVVVVCVFQRVARRIGVFSAGHPDVIVLALDDVDRHPLLVDVLGDSVPVRGRGRVGDGCVRAVPHLDVQQAAQPVERQVHQQLPGFLGRELVVVHVRGVVDRELGAGLIQRLVELRGGVGRVIAMAAALVAVRLEVEIDVDLPHPTALRADIERQGPAGDVPGVLEVRKPWARQVRDLLVRRVLQRALERIGQQPPVVAPVCAQEHARIAPASDDDVGVEWVDRQQAGLLVLAQSIGRVGTRAFGRLADGAIGLHQHLFQVFQPVGPSIATIIRTEDLNVSPHGYRGYEPIRIARGHRPDQGPAEGGDLLPGPRGRCVRVLEQLLRHQRLAGGSNVRGRHEEGGHTTRARHLDRSDMCIGLLRSAGVRTDAGPHRGAGRDVCGDVHGAAVRTVVLRCDHEGVVGSVAVVPCRDTLAPPELSHLALIGIGEDRSHTGLSGQRLQTPLGNLECAPIFRAAIAREQHKTSAGRGVEPITERDHVPSPCRIAGGLGIGRRGHARVLHHDRQVDHAARLIHPRHSKQPHRVRRHRGLFPQGLGDSALVEGERWVRATRECVVADCTARGSCQRDRPVAGGQRRIERQPDDVVVHLDDEIVRVVAQLGVVGSACFEESDRVPRTQSVARNTDGGGLIDQTASPIEEDPAVVAVDEWGLVGGGRVRQVKRQGARVAARPGGGEAPSLAVGGGGNSSRNRTRERARHIAADPAGPVKPHVPKPQIEPDRAVVGHHEGHTPLDVRVAQRSTPGRTAVVGFVELVVALSDGSSTGNGRFITGHHEDDVGLVGGYRDRCQPLRFVGECTQRTCREVARSSTASGLQPGAISPCQAAIERPQVPIVPHDVDDPEREIHPVGQIHPGRLVVHAPDVGHWRGGGGVDELPGPARVVADGQTRAGADDDIVGVVWPHGDPERLELIEAVLVRPVDEVPRVGRVVDQRTVQDRVGAARHRADPALALVVADLDPCPGVRASVEPGRHVNRLMTAGVDLWRNLHVPRHLREMADDGLPIPTLVAGPPQPAVLAGSVEVPAVPGHPSQFVDAPAHPAKSRIGQVRLVRVHVRESVADLPRRRVGQRPARRVVGQQRSRVVLPAAFELAEVAEAHERSERVAGGIARLDELDRFARKSVGGVFGQPDRVGVDPDHVEGGVACEESVAPVGQQFSDRLVPAGAIQHGLAGLERVLVEPDRSLGVVDEVAGELRARDPCWSTSGPRWTSGWGR